MAKTWVRFFEASGRQCFECNICGGRGSALATQNVEELAEAHLDKARQHYRVVAGRDITASERRRGLSAWMILELSLFSVDEDIAIIAADVAKGFLSTELRQRDEKIASLTRQLEAARGSSNGADGDSKIDR